MQKNALFFRENLHSWHKFYTTAGRDGRDKSQLWFRGVCSSFAEGGVSAVKIVNLIWCSEIVKIVNLVCTQNPDESAHSRRDLHFRLYFTLITLTYGGSNIWLQFNQNRIYIWSDLFGIQNNMIMASTSYIPTSNLQAGRQ